MKAELLRLTKLQLMLRLEFLMSQMSDLLLTTDTVKMISDEISTITMTEIFTETLITMLNCRVVCEKVIMIQNITFKLL